MKYLIPLFLVVASSLRLLAGDNLGTGEPGLKIIYKTTNQFAIYLDEPWTVGPDGIIGGYDKRHIDVLFDRNYELKEKLQTRKWDDNPQQLYSFDVQRGFTCESAKLGLDPKTFTHWPHQTQVFSINGDFLSVSDDLYALARHQYGLTTNQFFLGKIGTNVFYWEMGDPREAYYRPVTERKTASYFELPAGMIDLFGVTKSVKKDVGFVVLKKSTGFFSYSPNEFVFLEFWFKDAKQTTVNQ
jgi:hypothetical protein